MHCIAVIFCVAQMYAYVPSLGVDRHMCGVLSGQLLHIISLFLQINYDPMYLCGVHFNGVCGSLKEGATVFLRLFTKMVASTPHMCRSTPSDGT